VSPHPTRPARALPGGFLRRIDDIEICGVLRMVSVGDKAVDLSPSEFDVLMVLAANTNTMPSRDRIIASIKGGGHAINVRGDMLTEGG